LVALPETLRGLPLHVLVVHGVVVLVPLVAVGTLLTALWPAVRRYFGALVVVGALAATALVPVATGSGENLERQLGAEELVRDHSAWGERMLPTMIVLSASVLALVLLNTLRRTGQAAARRAEDADEVSPANQPDDGGIRTATRPTTTPLTALDRWLGARAPAGLRTPSAQRTLIHAERVVAVIAAVAALIALYVVFQTGESGAEAVWGGR
jgi:hypothetical protein